jgi:hypothetical protein
MTTPAPQGSLILDKLLDRLMTGLLNGPAMNCRPHNSRQRVDVASLGKLEGVDPTELLRTLLSEDATAKIVAKTPKAVARKSAPPLAASPASDDVNANPQAEVANTEDDAQLTISQLLTKLRVMTQDARVYTQDTGVHALALGFPLLTMPPGTLGKEMSRRVIAPIAFIPVEITVTRGVNTSVEISCFGDGVDRVVPNVALFAWLEQLTGRKDLMRAFEDERGNKPLREIIMLVAAAAKALELAAPDFVPPGHEQMPADEAPDLQLPETFKLEVSPRRDADKDKAQILPSAVLGLFPMANQGLIEDMKSFVENGPVPGPMESFLTANLALDAVHAPPPLPGRTLDPNLPKVGPTSVRLVTDADPCQRQVIRMAQSTRGVVIHGPPGTGKSQTIVNLIGDHLSRGQRVLFVCDKRTALDVVLNRLSFNGLGDLCAVVHDPQTDQREFYRAVREQLDGLQEKKISPRSETMLAQVDDELNKLHGELLTYHHALSKPPTPDGESFHELVGKWFSIPASKVPLPPQLAGITADSLGAQATALQELFDRGTAVKYPANPWAGLATIDLSSFMSRPVSEVRQATTAVAESIAQSDQTLVEGAPAFLDSIDLNAQAADRTAFASDLQKIQTSAPPQILPALLAMDAPSLTRLQARLFEASSMLDRVKAAPLDGSMAATAKSLNLTPPQINQQITALQEYIESTKRLLGALSFGTKNAAKSILAPFGLSLDAGSAIRLKVFLEAFRDRVLLHMIARDFLSLAPVVRGEGRGEGSVTSTNPSVSTSASPNPLTLTLSPDYGGEGTDASLIQVVGGFLAVSSLLTSIDKKPSLTPYREAIYAQLKTSEGQATLISQFASAKDRAASITSTLTVSSQSQLLSMNGSARLKSLLYANRPLADRAKAMIEQLDSFEGVVRIEKSLADMQPGTAEALRSLMVSGVDARGAILVIQRNAIEAEIRKRIAADPTLQQVDPQRLQTMGERLASMEKDRQLYIRGGILQFWTNKAQTRLVDGNKLNGMGADLKRRFLLTGKNAMRLRKVIQLGNAIENGDPLFDLRPVWMASPETVAQLFARKPMFDVVIFDEASQCRLEEALPVLARAKRIVIAGDEKQLPPTRFFESAVGGEEEREVQTSQDLFESAQAATEDLLGAALQLQIQEAYLDVHYRSKNADLIEFSNRHFYGSRLQAIPTHPAKLPTLPPIELIRVDGTYKSGENEKEADAVVELVKKLLAEKKPPSIGIACMNVMQRDLIMDALDEAAEEDEAFAKQLDTSRARTGSGSFEGLFVKNLENVQGDERDHIIISTTYGPDANGKFYQRFGPLQLQGGGRRLNVLVTRAREAVHLITSIPAGSYRSLPPAPEGSTPTGGWLLYAYLKYAEELAAKYAAEPRAAVEDAKPSVTIMEKQAVSPLASAIASNLLVSQSIGGIVNWGNEGFCVDYAMAKKDDPSSINLGVLVDGTRFGAVDDPIAWDIFRADIHQKQGWTLQRIWSPHFFRDPEGNLRRIVAANA